MTAIRTQTVRERQDKSVGHAERRRRRAGTLRTCSLISPVSGVYVAAEIARGGRHLFRAQIQAILALNGGLLGECRLNCGDQDLFMKAIMQKPSFLIAAAVFFVLFCEPAYHQGANAQGYPAIPVEGCPVSGLFSANAITIPIDLQAPYRGKAWRTTDVYDDGFSRSDCYLLSPAEILPNMSHIDILLAWANQEGLEQDGIFAVDYPHPHSKMLARKYIDGREIIIEHRLFLFEDSFALVTTAADQANFPTPRNQAFLDSLEVEMR